MVRIAGRVPIPSRYELGHHDEALWDRDGDGRPRDPWQLMLEFPARELDGGEWQPAEKRSIGKRSHGGRKHAARRFDAKGTALAEMVRTGRPPDPRDDERPLQIRHLVDGNTAVS